MDDLRRIKRGFKKVEESLEEKKERLNGVQLKKKKLCVRNRWKMSVIRRMEEEGEQEQHKNTLMKGKTRYDKPLNSLK